MTTTKTTGSDLTDEAREYLENYTGRLHWRATDLLRRLIAEVERTRAIDAEPFEVGELVNVTLDSGGVLMREVTRLPWQREDGTWAVGLKGMGGGYDLDRVRRIRPPANGEG